MADTSKTSADDPTAVPWNDLVRFVRQLSHDLRNHLNAAELQSVFLNELATDAEMKGEIKRLRAMIAELGTVLQKLSTVLAQPKATTMPYRAADLMEDIRRKFENDFPEKKSMVQWEVEVGDAMLNVDPQLLQQAMFELLDNAARHGAPGSPSNLTARTDKNRFVLTLCEPKAQFDLPTQDWGREPLRHVGQGHYGLGLTRVRAIIEVHGGTFGAEFDSTLGALVSTIALPLSDLAG